MRCLKNGTEIPKKILNHKWDELIDHTVLINKMKPGRLLGLWQSTFNLYVNCKSITLCNLLQFCIRFDVSCFIPRTFVHKSTGPTELPAPDTHIMIIILWQIIYQYQKP